MNELLDKLESAILGGRAMHAYLITGADQGLSDRAARNAAALMLYGSAKTELLGEDPDYMEYEGSVSIGDFRDIIRPEIYRETYGRKGRVVVFRNAARLSAMVQNAMLKVLEEPPENTHFFLTGSEYGILPTIRSRCTVIRLSGADRASLIKELLENGASRAEAETYARFSGGNTNRALSLFGSEEARNLRTGAIRALIESICGRPDFKWSRVKRERADFIEANEIMLLACHDMLLLKCGMPVEYCTDFDSELKKASSFCTFADLNGIVKGLTETAERLASSAPGGAAFDRLFADVSELAPRKRDKR